MVNPNHVFSEQDYLRLYADVDENERKIQQFHPRNGKLCLLFQESFKDEQLSTLSESISLIPEKHELKHLWFALTEHSINCSISFCQVCCVVRNE